MTDIAQLRYDAENLRKRIQDRRHEIDKSAARAADFNAAGDFDRAAIENEHARRKQQEITQLEQTVLTYDNRADELETKASDLERQRNELQTRMQTEIDKLGQQIKALRGTSSYT